MDLYLDRDAQIAYTSSQLNLFFPCGNTEATGREIGRCIDLAYDRLEHCFSRISVKYHTKDGKPFFSPLITDQYATFLYFLANGASTIIENVELADRLYALNKALHGLDVYYQVRLPEVFLLVHCVGTVLGRASYGDYLVVYQGVTVGGNLDLEYPTIGKGVGLFANSSVVGNSVIGDGSMVAAGSLVMGCQVPAGSVCYGTHPENRCKPLKKSVFDHYFVR
ncbi:MAG: hypothetical protein JXR23_06620 [Pontiellaceae bacterium]|nr:hypothetical protein [Pontiellaceae bacterium]